MKLSFVIPCYRSEKTIAHVVSEIISTIKPFDYEYEVIMVCDNSPDDVYRVVEEMCLADPTHLIGVELSCNSGQHAALMAGYKLTTGDIIISLDDDGQAPVESVLALVAKVKEGADACFGAYEVRQFAWYRNFGSWVNDQMAEHLIGKPKDLKVSSFFAMSRFVCDAILDYKHAFPYILGLILRVTKKIVNTPVKHRSREIGATGYTFFKLIELWLNGFTAFSIKPLRIATTLGFISAIIGFLIGLWAIFNKLVLSPDAPIGYSSLMAVIVFIGGMLMMMLGMVGEYVGRSYMCINETPQYVIRRTTIQPCP